MRVIPKSENSRIGDLHHSPKTKLMPMGFLGVILICFFIITAKSKNNPSKPALKAFIVDAIVRDGLFHPHNDSQETINHVLEKIRNVERSNFKSLVVEGPKNRNSKSKGIRNSELKRRRIGNEPVKFLNTLTALTPHAKYAVSIVLQLNNEVNLGFGLAHVLSFYDSIRKVHEDQIDIVLFLSDLQGSSLEEIVVDEIWQYFESIPGFFLKTGALCSEFTLQVSDINVFSNGQRVKNVTISHLMKIKGIKLDMYDRVAQYDWDLLPLKPMLEIFQQDMRGAKVMTQTNGVAPFVGDTILIQPDFYDYRYICEHIINGVGWHDSSNGWNDHGNFLSPYCSGSDGWGVCDPPQYLSWNFHGAMSEKGLFFYYYGLLHDWLLTIDKAKRGPQHYYRKFGSDVFEGGVWNGTGIFEAVRYKGSSKIQQLIYSSYAWRESLYEAYHKLNMSQIEIFKVVYEKMLAYEHKTQNTWEL